MSRIAGILSSDPRMRERVPDMLSALSRGAAWTAPVLSSAGGALGWCGWQAPRTASSPRTHVVIDGRIYNRAELGDFASDAEAILAWHERGLFEESLRRINGDFAIAVLDRDAGTLWLARDRFGLKPLYYAATAAGFLFGSQPRALLALPDVSPEPDRQFVGLFAGSHYRYFDNRPERSAFRDIRQLPAAHVLCARGTGVETRSYWRLEDEADHDRPEDLLAEEYRALLFDAVAVRLRGADRPVFTLSGGMDSSSVLASAVRLTGAKQAAVSTVYDDGTYDESAEIGSMLEATTSAWHAVGVGAPDVFGLVNRMVREHDEPVATATWLSHRLLCDEVQARGFGSVFGGLGGDELNAGEYEHFFFHFADLARAGERAQLDAEIAGWARHHDHPIYRKTPDVAAATLQRVTDMAVPGRCLPDPARLRRYGAALNRDYFDLDAFEPALDHPFASYLKNRTWQDLARETVPCCVRAEDRHQTSSGLEGFLPFLDHRLVEFMFRVPGRLKFRHGVAKYLLREAMRGVLPEATRTRVKKTGWNAPAHAWFAGPMRPRLMDLIHSREFADRGIYDVSEVQRLAEEHIRIVETGAPVENHMMFFWQLVNLETWLAMEPRAVSVGQGVA